MTLVRVTISPEDVPQAMELAESLGAEGGEMVMHPIYKWEVPEFKVPDSKTSAFVRGFWEVGVAQIMTTNC